MGWRGKGQVNVWNSSTPPEARNGRENGRDLLPCGYGDGRPYRPTPQHQSYADGQATAALVNRIECRAVRWPIRSIVSLNLLEHVWAAGAPSSCLHLNDVIRFFMFRTWNQSTVQCIEDMHGGWSIDVRARSALQPSRWLTKVKVQLGSAALYLQACRQRSAKQNKRLATALASYIGLAVC